VPVLLHLAFQIHQLEQRPVVLPAAVAVQVITVVVVAAALVV
jgi:hypothetical protein